ncbi:hypothetical protein KKA15_02690 [Patescibacteria group bacterium]|nr:hypothetical protein [Patescibacteria group bacterium]
MSKDKIKLTLLVILLVMFIGTSGLWLVKSWQNNSDFNLFNLALPIILLLIIAVVIPVIIRNAKSVKDNVPVEDERSKKASYKAGHYTFLFSIYLLLFLGWFGDDYFTRPSQATGTAILVMAIVFISLLLYFERKGKL